MRVLLVLLITVLATVAFAGRSRSSAAAQDAATLAKIKSLVHNLSRSEKIEVIVSLFNGAISEPMTTLPPASNKDTNADVDQKLRDAYHLFLIKYKKRYPEGEDMEARFALFVNTCREVDQHNKGVLEGKHTSIQEVNKFADMTPAEKRSMSASSIDDEPSSSESKQKPWNNHANATSLDWSLLGAVNPGLNQNPCGSCWTFASTSAVEGCLAISKQGLVQLSQQQLQDCYFKKNCKPGGGSVSKAMRIIQEQGVTTNQVYPYIHNTGKCRNNVKSVVKVGQILRANNEDELLNLVKRGPVAIALASRDLHKYKKGVITNTSFAKRPIDHAVLLVGFANNCDNTGRDCWIVRNSWGERWGEKGYFRVERGKNIFGISKGLVAVDCKRV
ncbi:cathepsin H [Acrasis kona]|uniref:Cathepsin H n=1 Tax=Acrasis kona TaxID=1008807 RepID=A0AAW2ZAW6_9EUKA